MIFQSSRLVLLVINRSRLVIRGSRPVVWSRSVLHDSRWVFMVFHDSRPVFHGSSLVFHGFSLDNHGFW